MVWFPCKIWTQMGIFWFLLSVGIWPSSFIFLSLLTILQSERKLNPGLTGRVFFISLDSAPFDLYLLANDFLNPKWFGNNCSSFSDYCPSPIVNLWNPPGLEYILVCVCHKLAWTGIAAHVQLHLQSCCESCRKTCLDGVKYSPGERASPQGSETPCSALSCALNTFISSVLRIQEWKQRVYTKIREKKPRIWQNCSLPATVTDFPPSCFEKCNHSHHSVLFTYVFMLNLLITWNQPFLISCLVQW